ncbi:MAG: PilZ domain-containing protein [Candidatus Omnitrophica bacterium]|nr:PilZ domain-containing protein [Candidatus Omnitrophota bacterium]
MDYNQNQYRGEERRKYKREGYFSPIKCFINEEDSLVETAISYNVSEGGIGIIVKNDKPIGKNLSLILYLPQLNSLFQLKGKVINSRGFPSNTQGKIEFELGIEFIDINQEDRDKIREYLKINV